MKNNKRKAQFGNAAALINYRMISRSQRLRIGSVVEIKEDAYFGEWVLNQIKGKRGVVVKLNDIGWEKDHNGHWYIVGGWDAVVRYSSLPGRRKDFGIDAYKLNVISPRQLREERLQRNRELRARQLTAFEKMADSFNDVAATIKTAFQLFFDGLKKSDFVLQH